MRKDEGSVEGLLELVLPPFSVLTFYFPLFFTPNRKNTAADPIFDNPSTPTTSLPQLLHLISLHTTPHPPSPIFHLPSPSPAPQPFQTPNSARETRHFEMRRRDCAGEGCWAGLGVLVVGREGVERWEVGEEEVGMICSREIRDELSMPRL